MQLDAETNAKNSKRIKEKCRETLTLHFSFTNCYSLIRKDRYIYIYIYQVNALSIYNTFAYNKAHFLYH